MSAPKLAQATAADDEVVHRVAYPVPSSSPSCCTAPLRCLATLRGHTDRVWQVSWSADGALLASCSADRTVRVWRCGGDSGDGGSQWRCVAVLSEGHERSVRALAFSPCGRWLASAGFDGRVCLWDRRAGWQCCTTLEGHESEVKSVHWAASGRLLATCSRDKSVWIWEVSGGGAGEAVAAAGAGAATAGGGSGDGGEDEPEVECVAMLMTHTQDVKCVRWSPARDELASASYDDTVCIYVCGGGGGVNSSAAGVADFDEDWCVVATLRGHDSTVWNVAWSPSGDALATSSHDLSVRVWRRHTAASWSCTSVLTGHHTEPVYSLAWLGRSAQQSLNHDWSHRQLIATASGDNAVRLFCQPSPAEEAEEVVEGVDSCRTRFNLVHCEWQAHDQDVNSVEWRPDTHCDSTQHQQQPVLASGGDDRLVKLWCVDTSLLLQT